MLDVIKRRLLIVLFFTVLSSVLAKTVYAQTWHYDSHLKLRVNSTVYPDNSVFAEANGRRSDDWAINFRHNLSYKNGAWSAELAYEGIGIYADSLAASALQDNGIFNASSAPTDQARLLDLTETLDTDSDYRLLHRLDRLALGYNSVNTVVKIGRQAISWGNGLAYNPVDFLNPFDPAAVDTDYKPGDDMVYLQHLFANGNDVQLVWVGRRSNGQTSSELHSSALKYHGFAGQHEFDVLLAKHYDDTVLALGGVTSIGGAVWRGDWLRVDTGDEASNSWVTSISYSWSAMGKNVTGFIEAFRNGFGVEKEDYLTVLQQPNHPLRMRYARGELFTLGKYYLMASATVEMTPLWQLTPTVFFNIGDDSGLLQAISRHDLSQNVQLIFSANLPVGSNGSEYGGIRAPSINGNAEPRFFSSNGGLFAQLAWYF